MTESTERKPRRDDLIEYEVEALDARGLGVGTYRDHAVRLRGALPGSRVRARVRKRRRSRIDAVLEQVLRASPDAVEPRCAHFGTCGGCTFQGLAYDAQLRFFGERIAELVAPLEPTRVDPVIGCADPWHYRNKMDFTFGNRRWIEAHEPEGAPRDFALGLHVPGRFDKVLHVDACDIAFREATPILGTVRALAQEAQLEPWDVRAHRGLLRHLVLRRAEATGEIMAVLVTTEPDEARVRPLVERVLERHPEIHTFVQLVNDGLALVATGEERVLHGPGTIREVVDGLVFEISATSFFQTNTAQAQVLLHLVLEQAGALAGNRALDLCCGTGLFALALARAGARVTGFEVVESAIADARRAAERNGIEGVELVAGDLAMTLAQHAAASAQAGPPDLVVVDPPRAGLHPEALAALLALAPARVLYVSCHPAGAVTELAQMRTHGYALERVQPVDLFPHTPHLECLFTLAREAQAPQAPRATGAGRLAPSPPAG